MSPRTSGRARLLLAMEPLTGGTLRHLRMVLQAVPRDEFEVELAVSGRRSPRSDALYAAWREAGFAVHDLPMVRELSPRSDLASLGHLCQLCRRRQFDVVHTHSSKAGFLGRLAGRLHGAVTLHTPHVFPFDRWPGDRRYLPLERIASRWTGRYLVLSDYQAAQVTRYGMGTDARVTRLPNAVDPAQAPLIGQAQARRRLQLPQRVPLVLGVGRLCRQKGFDVLVEAARLLAARGEPTQFAILGAGPQAPSLRGRIQKAGLADRVLTPGYMENVGTWYAACDIVALPSRYEGMPYVLLEAKAARRPVIATRVSGMEEFLTDGEDGYVVPPEDPDALAATLRGLADRRVHLAKMGNRALANLRPEWRREHFESALVDIYRRAADRR